MKRKDWKIKNLKKGIFGKKIKKIRRVRERFLFLRKLFMRQNRYFTKKNLFVNFFFLKNFLNLYKFKKQNYYKNLFLKTKIDLISVLPEYSFTKNVFNKKIKFKQLEKKHNLNLFFLSNKKNKFNFGLNYYFVKDINLVNFSKELEDEDSLNLVYFKINEIFNNNFQFNYYFNYNVHNLCLIELYKILIIINLTKIKLNIKYIYVNLSLK